jgi:chemotaxis regulatin CheY-phosphate phosphatase CheZ
MKTPALSNPPTYQPDYIMDAAPLAAAELETACQETAAAAMRIMDAAEKIQSISEILQNEEIALQLQQHVAAIFEASTFQDITGQRLKKVMRSLAGVSIVATEKAGQEGLLNGPQINLPSQSDIDRLFEA